jgi:predicted P-loop ATPase
MSELLKFAPVPSPREPEPEPPPPLSAAERQRLLFEWADDVLKQWGIIEAIERANTPAELSRVQLDDVKMMLAIRDALHPADGAQPAECFSNVGKHGLKLIIKNRFTDKVKDRKAELRNPGAAGNSSSPPAPDWTDGLILGNEGEILPLLANLILILSKSPKWDGVLAFDEFNVRVVIRKQPPWGAEAPDALWNDHHETLLRCWFQCEDICANHSDVGRAVQAAARNNPYHPVRTYFDALVWDDVPRLDIWLTTYLHADDAALPGRAEYVRAVGSRFLISAVARIYRPGCKVDYVLVLEGEQGQQKSEAIATLAGPWGSDRIAHLDTKDAQIEIAGVLMFELAELDRLLKHRASTVKAFLTRRRERFRPVWGTHTINVDRQCVFAGTTNLATDGYLTDATGGRRYWPIVCQGMIDLEGLARDRDQLWAEAVARFKAGARWWLETPELEALAREEQDLRYRETAQQEIIKRWIDDKVDVSKAEVIEGALAIAPDKAGRWPQTLENDVVAVLTKLGFVKYRANQNGVRSNRYRRRV